MACSRCKEREGHAGALLCKPCQRIALRDIRRDQAQKLEMLREEEPE